MSYVAAVPGYAVRSMHRRAVRLTVVVLLVAGGVGAAFVTRDLHRRLTVLTTNQQDVTARVDAMQIAAAEAAAVQQALGAAEQPQPSSVQARLADLPQRIDVEAARVRPELRSVQAATLLQTLADRDTPIETLRATLTALGDAENSAFSAERAALERQLWTVVGALAATWLVGLILLARVPKPIVAAAPATTPMTQPMMMPPTDEPAAVGREPGTAPTLVDLGAAADLCTAIARVTSASALPDILARAASVLDASGIVLWMGAGQELFAASAYGYDPAVISRLGPISRSADNATAAAWRTGEIRTVSGDMVSNGAVVAPMLGPSACIGVLAAEIRHGREEDPGTRAVTAMIAAQLATIVAAWPGTSNTPEPPQATT